MVEIEELEIGTGEEARDGHRVAMHYKGTFQDGRKFDSSYDRNQPFSFSIGKGEVIKGFDLGVLGMKVGGKRKVKIPADLAYGKRGAGGVIPPDTDLIFELELLGVK